MVNAAINVSDYTTRVDVAFKSVNRRKHVQLQQIVAFLSGIIACQGYEAATQILGMCVRARVCACVCVCMCMCVYVCAGC